MTRTGSQRIAAHGVPQVLGNITVGENAVVAAHALVNKPVPPGHVAVGVPAKLITPEERRRPRITKQPPPEQEQEQRKYNLK